MYSPASNENISSSQNWRDSGEETANSRKLKLRKLLDTVEGIDEAEETGLDTIKKVGDIFHQINIGEDNDNPQTGQTDEALLDSKVVVTASEVLTKCVEALDISTRTYDPLEYAKKVSQKIKDDDAEDIQPLDLIKILEDANSIIPEVPSYEVMYGAFNMNKLPEPKQKKERTIRQVREALQRKEPEKVRELEKEEDGIEEIVKFLYNVLTKEYEQNDNQPIKYYSYVIDTESFSKTVENVFYFSFLIRDGKAHLDLDNSGTPLIKPMKKKDLKEMREQGGINSQIVTSITMTEWEKYQNPGFLQKHRQFHLNGTIAQ